MDKVVLVNPPNKDIVLRDMYSSTISKGLYNWPNVDLLVLSGILRDTYDVTLIDANTLGMSLDETVEIISAFNPMGICCAFGASVKNDDYQFIKALHLRLPNARIIGNGGILYHNALEEMQKHPELDACLLNFTTDDIVKYFSSQYEKMNNVVFRHNGKIIETPLIYPPNNFSYSVPLHEELPLTKYRLSHGRNIPLSSVLTSYGCPARCSFCIAGRIDYRYRDPANVVEELDMLHSIGVREIFFRDNTFCASKLPGYKLLKAMIEKDYSFSWVGDTRASVITEETVELMKASGCHALHIGVESSNQEIIDRYKKSVTIDQIRRAFALCKCNGIATVGYFILGLPGETREDVLRTIDFAVELDCDYASFNIPIPIIGTKLREEALENNWVYDVEATYDGSATPLIRTKFLTPDEINELRNIAYKKFYFRINYALKSIARLKNLHQIKMLLLEIINMIKTH